MHYTIIRLRSGTHGGQERSYQLTREPDGQLVLDSDGERLAVDVRHLADGDVHLLIDGRSFDLTVGLEGHEALCTLLGRNHGLHVYNDRQLRLLRLEEASGGSFDPEVRSPMAGKVIAVQVAVGDRVEEHAALVVIEAMKMENILRAEQPGRVEAVAVQVGQPVEAGQRLVVLAPLEES
jgi:3-methylcrotonyl-CoA carboxylase alpha subunit